MPESQGTPVLTGEQLEEYCLQNGICPLCAQTKTHEKVGPFRLKLAGSGSKKNKNAGGGSGAQAWKPISLTMEDAIQQQQQQQQDKGRGRAREKTEAEGKKGGRKGLGGLFGKAKQNGSGNGDKASDSEDSEPHQSENQWLVYRGFCLRPGCFTLEQAKRLIGEVGPFETPIPSGDYGYYLFVNQHASWDATKTKTNGGTTKKLGIGRSVKNKNRNKKNNEDADEQENGGTTKKLGIGRSVKNKNKTWNKKNKNKDKDGTDPEQHLDAEQGEEHNQHEDEQAEERNEHQDELGTEDGGGDTGEPRASKKKGGMSRLFGGNKNNPKPKDLSGFDPSMTGFSASKKPGASSSLKGGRRGDANRAGDVPPLRSISTPTTASVNDDYSVGGSVLSGGSGRHRKNLTGKIRRRGLGGGDDDDFDDDVSIGSAMTSESRVRTSLKELLFEQQQQQQQQPTNPMLAASGASTTGSLLLDLSHTRLHHVHVLELVQALDVATSLQTLILENCKLNDNELEVIGKGLLGISGTRPPLSLVRLSLRSNKISNRGVVGLCPYFMATTTLRELDLSKNQIGSRGASSVLHAFRDNPSAPHNSGDTLNTHRGSSGSDEAQKLPIEMINFAHNEIWDVDDGSFFSQNTTLKLFNLEGNFVHDEGVQTIADGLQANPGGTKLAELYLGWNGIGDEGCLHLARMIETNSTVTKMGLGENDITSIGARALLNALAQNQTLQRITGLYHNMIDRKFVIECINRILYSHLETLPAELEQVRRAEFERLKRASMSATDTLLEPLGSHLPIPDEISEGELDWADRLYNDETDLVESGVTIGEVPREETPSALGQVDTEEGDIDEAAEPKTIAMMSQFGKMPEPKSLLDRLVVFQAAPLVYLHRETAFRQAIPLHDFDQETAIIQNSLNGCSRLDATIDMDVQPATAESFASFLASGRGRVLHFTGYGHPNHLLALEDEAGYLDDTFSLDTLPDLVKSANPPLDLVVVNSFHSGRIGKAFLDAGVPHVVCCHHPETFRDKAANSFLKNFYRALATNKSLKQAFYHSQEAVRVEEISKDVDRYVLLPRKPEDDPYHDVPIFYTQPVPANTLDQDTDNLLLEDGRKLLPKLPRHFTGREVDMCKVLDALRNQKLVRIGGFRGIGKSSLAAAVCRYVQKRSGFFEFDNVFWLPAARGVVPDEDTLFADLVEYTSLMVKADHNISEDEDALECRERIEIELEGQSTLLAIDSRKFDSEVSAECLETFLSELLNTDLEVKVILINSNEEDEEATLRLAPIDFKSTSLLFGMVSRFITANGCPAAQSPDEYADLIVPPSIAIGEPPKSAISVRQERLLSVMGDGIPLQVIRSAKSMQANIFIRLISMANTPEVHVDSLDSLEVSISKWTSRMEHAIENKNFFRALDLQHVLKELEGQRSKFPSVDDLVAREKELHRKHTLCFKTRRYEEGNRIKREILVLKKEILRQKRRLATNRHITDAALTQSQTNKIADIQAQMKSIMKLANSSFSSLTDLQESPDKNEAVFRLGSAYHSCQVRIYPGNVEDFDPGDDLGASICWTNECCDINLDEQGASLLSYGGQNLADDAETLPAIAETPWGTTKCGTGNAVIVGPGNYDDLRVHCVILAVGPISPTRDEVLDESDEDSLHYITVMMRSCLRSSFILAKHSQVQSIAVPTLTTKVGSPTYESTLLTNLKLLVDEAKFSDLNTLHIVARSDEESTKLIDMALTMGLTMS